jgi:hypothetical protein
MFFRVQAAGPYSGRNALFDIAPNLDILADASAFRPLRERTPKKFPGAES